MFRAVGRSISMENSLVSGKEHVLGVELCPAKAEGICAADEQCFCFQFSEQKERWGLALGESCFSMAVPGEGSLGRREQPLPACHRNDPRESFELGSAHRHLGYTNFPSVVTVSRMDTLA